MSQKIKYMNIKEFREKGYLQELNRLFLHPLGLALEVVIDDGDERLGGIWDYREDEEGIIYDDETIQHPNFKKKAEFIKNEFSKRKKQREKLLGYSIQPIP